MNAQSQSRSTTNSAAQSHEKGRVPIILLSIFVAGTVIVILGGLGTPGYKIVPALLWAFGFCVSGMLLGFLFAIPRTLPSGVVIATRSPGTGNDQTNNAYSGSRSSEQPESNGTHLPAPQSEINSNLVEVSDWLTKIIVGVGLVELKNLPANAESVARFIAPSLEIHGTSGVPLAGGIMLFFSVLGFLKGYLLTRIYLAIIIKWADNQVKIQNDPVRLESGKEIELVELTRLQQITLSDIQRTVAELVFATPQNAQTMAQADVSGAEKSTKKGKVLWVDDHPTNNTLLVEQLKRAGNVVVQVTSTSDALKALKSTRFDVVITDMERLEGQQSIPDAGVSLTRKIRESFPNLQVIVYTSDQMATRQGSAAAAAGARLVVTSGSHLIAVLNKILFSVENTDEN